MSVMERARHVKDWPNARFAVRGHRSPAQGQALQKMKRFLDGDENRVGDYRRIEDYFKCLAFDPRSPEPTDTEHSTGE